MATAQVLIQQVERVPSSTTFLTLFTTDYWPRAAALGASLRAVYGDEAELFALHVGEPPDRPFPDQPGLRTVELDVLELPTLWDMAFRYEKGALANALKPFFMAHVLERLERRSVVFLDADTLVYDRLDEVHALLERDGGAIVLTPHFDRPQHRVREPLEIDLLRAGVMNGGFVAVSNADPARSFLAWWSDHLLTDCRYDLEQGFYGDQHWLALVPALFDGVHVLRHRGYNAAYWNYPDRSPRLADGRWWIGAERLKFFHFSQWRLERDETVSDCMRRLFWSEAADLEQLLRDYESRWSRAADLLPPALRCASDPFGVFGDGSPIPTIVRDAYGRLNPPRAWAREELFGQGLALVMGPSSEAPVFAGVTMTELYAHIWQSRPDLRHHDLFSRKGQIGFLRWLVEHGAGDYGLPDEALEPAQLSIERGAEHPVRALLKGVADHHAKLRDGATTIEVVASRAADLLRLFVRALGGPEQPTDPIDRAAALFRAIDGLKGRTEGREGADDVLHEIEAHGRYLADKTGLAYADFLADAPAAPDTMLEADAVLNACAVMATAIERWAEHDERAAALSILPSSARARPTDEPDQTASPLPAWASGQLAGLAAIDPNLGAQLERKAPITPVSRMRPDEHPLHRCLVANREVLDPPPLAVVGLARRDALQAGFGGGAPLDPVPLDAALVGAAQQELGIGNVLVLRLDDSASGPIAGLDPASRVFAPEHWRPYLSRPQCAEFTRAYLAMSQPPSIVNCGCPILWGLFRDHGQPLSKISRLVAVLSRFEETKRGHPVGFAATHLAEAMPHLAAVYVETASSRQPWSDGWPFLRPGPRRSGRSLRRSWSVKNGAGSGPLNECQTAGQRSRASRSPLIRRPCRQADGPRR